LIPRILPGLNTGADLVDLKEEFDKL